MTAAKKRTNTRSATTSPVNARSAAALASHPAKPRTTASPRSGEQPAKQHSSESARLSAEEKAAIRERAAEVKTAARRVGKGKSGAQADAADALSTIAALPEPDRSVAQGIHAIALKIAPYLTPRLWYGMPAFAVDGTVMFFIQPASKFKTRYLTLGFSDTARLDSGGMWPTAFAITKWNRSTQALVRDLIQKAVDTR